MRLTVRDPILSVSQKLVLPWLFLVLVGCSNQAPKPGTFSAPSSGENDLDSTGAQPGKGPRPGKDYGSVGGEKPDAPVIEQPEVDVTDPVPPIDDSDLPSIPQPVTGAPTDGKPKEEGQSVADGLYKIQNFFSKKCLMTHQEKKEGGAQLVQGSCDSSAAKFYISFVDKKHYRFQSQLSQLAVQVRGQLAMSEALIEQSEYRARDHQKWNIHQLNDNTIAIKPVMSDGLCLDVAHGSKDDNAAIQLWRECHALGQKWILIEAD